VEESIVNIWQQTSSGNCTRFRHVRSEEDFQTTSKTLRRVGHGEFWRNQGDGTMSEAMTSIEDFRIRRTHDSRH
jgi:hypothetical protein